MTDAMSNVALFLPDELAAVTHELGIEAGNRAILEVRLSKAMVEVARLAEREKQLTAGLVDRDRTIDQLRAELGAKALPRAAGRKK